ncbi:hypothetical protein CMI37_28905 [Candidatus Pacearchaeota archaeon]|nr:hypothetical protein [Candidatus Pacearchaeota archaeon]|tara:strand:- start:3717 stop:4004 length:288 start_codon:yes stop_codon:yes gene_type:complete
MVLTGLWVSKYGYQVTDSDSGKSETAFIMGTDDEMVDPVYIQELEHLARESVVRGWKREKPVPHTPEQRRDLGGSLQDISSSLAYRKENNHARWW